MSAAMRGLPGRRSERRRPASPKSCAPPAVNRGRLDKHQRVSPSRPKPLQADPEQTVGRAEPSIRTSEDALLVA